MTKLLYIDSSVALAVAFSEADAADLVERFHAAVAEGFQAVASALLLTEARRVFFRQGLPFDEADAAVAWIDLIDLDNDTATQAGLLPVHVKTLDALHLATALDLRDADTEVTLWALDRQMNRAARDLGLATPS